MNKSLETYIASFLVMMLLLLTSCGNGNTGKSADRFELTIMANLHTMEVFDNKIELLIEDMTRSELTIQWVPDGHYEERLKSAFAMGTLPQAVYLKNQASLAMFK